MTNSSSTHRGANIKDISDADPGAEGSEYNIQIEAWDRNTLRVTSIMLTDEQIPYLIEALCQYVTKK